MATRQTHQRKKCITENCRGFAVNKLPLGRNIIVMCKKCTCAEQEAKEKEQKQFIKRVEKEHKEIEKKISKFPKPMECGICYMDAKECTLVVIKPCEHWICATCVEHLKEQKCPFCRCDIEENPIAYKERQRARKLKITDTDRYRADLRRLSRERDRRRLEEYEEIAYSQRRQIERREREIQDLMEDLNEMINQLLIDVPRQRRARLIQQNRAQLLRTLGIYA